MKTWLLPLVVAVLAVGCRHSNEYKIIGFSEDPSISSGLSPTLGQKFIVTHSGVRFVTHCWIPEHHIVDTSCLALKSKVGDTVRMEYWADERDVLIYQPNGRNTQPEEMLLIDFANAE
jgi:hypothetical protein